jgi:hypothetical protein
MPEYEEYREIAEDQYAFDQAMTDLDAAISCIQDFESWANETGQDAGGELATKAVNALRAIRDLYEPPGDDGE